MIEIKLFEVIEATSQADSFIFYSFCVFLVGVAVGYGVRELKARDEKK